MTGSNHASSNEEAFLNRAFLYGDGVFETVKVIGSKVLFLEDHYFRLMSAMRIIRMEIPMDFTMEFFEEKLLAASSIIASRVRMTVYRRRGGFYLPATNDIDFIIDAIPSKQEYSFESGCEVELYKDAYVTAQLLSTIKSTNRLINVIASIYMNENGFDNCLLMNEQRNIVEAINANVFLYIDGRLITPPLSDGCINGVMRRNVIALVRKEMNIEVSESSVSPFDLQKADEIFLTNVISGLTPVTKYRKQKFGTSFAQKVTDMINREIAN